MTADVPGRLIGTGRNADVYDIGGGRVLRRYRDSRPPGAVTREAEVMRHARAHGVSVPEVFEVSGTDIVMERNVILTAGGPVIIDWEGAARGPGAADAAMTWVVFAFSQGLFTRCFLRAAGPVPRPVLDAAVEYRLRDPNVLPVESARIRRHAAPGDK